MKTKTARRALLTSALALLLCVTMLVGTTFAWFTDSVTSSGNIIKSGTLEVTMEWADGTKDPGATDTVWTDAATGPMFNYDKWEPGYVEVKHIKIANAGTLALKYRLLISANGVVSDLAKVIDVYYVDPATQVDERTDLANLPAENKLGTLKDVLADFPNTAAGELAKGENDTVTLALKMQETAGNEYQGMSIGTDFSVVLMATQLTAENDSFNNQYDAAAKYLNQDAEGNWLIGSVADLLYFAQQVNSGNSYKNETILLTADIDLGGMNWTPIGNGSAGFSGTFDGNGKSISNYSVEVKNNAGLFGYLLDGGNIKNLTVKGATIKATDYAGALLGRGYTDIVNCHAIDCEVTVTPALQANGEYDGGAKAGGLVGQLMENAGNILDCTAKNVKVIGYRDIGAVLGMAHDNNVVTDCKATDSEVSYLYLEPGKTYDGNKVNENIGEVVGRINSSATVTGSQFSNVKTNSIYVYGVKLTADGDNSKITVSDKEGLLNLTKLSADWRELFTDGNGNEWINYANGAGADYYYAGRWTVSLEADIDLNNATIAPITIHHPVNAGEITFNGNNHTIKNAKIVADATVESMTGLFNVTNEAFKNLKLDNIHVTGSNVGNSDAGILAGYCSGRIDNITITNSSVTGGKYTGGVVGSGYTDISNCTLTNVTVKGGYKLGGLVGYICAEGTDTGDVTGNTLTDCTVDGIGGGVYAGGKSEYVIGKVVGNYNCNGTFNNNTVTNMTTANGVGDIGKIENGKNVSGSVSVSSAQGLQEALENMNDGEITLDGDIDLNDLAGLLGN